MFSRINFFKIIKAHHKTLRSLNQSSNLINWKDLIIFYIFPIFLSVFLSYKSITIKSEISNLIAAISILGGFLFNLLAIIYNSMSNLKLEAQKDSLKSKYVKEIHSNISYCILTAIVLIMVLIIFSNYSSRFTCDCTNNTTLLIFEMLTIFLISHFFLTLLMVLNRIYVLLDKE